MHHADTWPIQSTLTNFIAQNKYTKLLCLGCTKSLSEQNVKSFTTYNYHVDSEIFIFFKFPMTEQISAERLSFVGF